MTDQEARDYAKISYFEALKILNNIEDAKDISQTVVFNLCEKKIKVDKKGKDKYIKKIAVNEALKYAKKRNRTITFASVEHLITDDLLDSSLSSRHEKYDIIQKNIKKLKYFERDLMKNYFNKGCTIKKIAIQRKESFENLKKKIYNLKKDTLAEYYRHAGMIGAKAIINSKLHRNIRNFIISFKLAIKNNTVNKMRIYFGKQLILNQIPNFDFARFHDYNIRLTGRNRFRLIVHYFDSKNEYNCYFLYFTTYYKNRIRITKLPKLPKKITGFKAAEIPLHIKEQLKPGKRGILSISDEKVDELLKDFKPVYER